MEIALYPPALALSTVTRIPLSQAVFLIGPVAISYTCLDQIGEIILSVDKLGLWDTAFSFSEATGPDRRSLLLHHGLRVWEQPGGHATPSLGQKSSRDEAGTT